MLGFASLTPTYVYWLETFAQNFSGALPEPDRQVFIAEVQEALRPQLCDAAGNWIADYVRLRFAATRLAILRTVV